MGIKGNHKTTIQEPMTGIFCCYLTHAEPPKYYDFYKGEEKLKSIRANSYFEAFDEFSKWYREIKYPKPESIMKHKERKEILKDTDDNWYGNYEGNKVELIYNGLLGPDDPEDECVWRVSCWGNDDFGIEKDFKTEKEAIEMFDYLEALPKINKQDLFDLGFVIF